MKSIGKKMIAGAIAASFVLGGSYVALSNSQAFAADATTSGTSAATQQQGHGPGHMGRGGFGGGNLVKEAATVLGQQESNLQTSLQSGKTLLDIAKAAGLTEDDFLAKLVDAEKTNIASQVTAGKLTQDQADKIVSGLSDRLKQQIEHTGPMGGPGRGGHGGPGGFGFGGGNLVKEAATVLGQQESDLQTSLQSGKTLLDIAKAAGLTEDDFLAKLVDAEKTNIASQVTAGKLTQDQADKIVSGLSDRLKQQIEHAGPMGDPGRGGHGGPGGFGGPMGNPDLLAGILGITQDDLRTQLDSGTSIADLAAAKGISEDDLISKIKDGMTDSIKNFVEAKHVKPANGPAANPSASSAAPTTNS